MVHRQEPVSACPSGASPVRTCVGCRGRTVAGELLRVAVVDGELVLDLRRRVGGRGAWIHPDLGCLTKAERRRAFARALRVSGPLDAGGLRVALEGLISSTEPGFARFSQGEESRSDPS
ncbi:MAG: YlxR family protein [Labedaea sp.]